MVVSRNGLQRIRTGLLEDLDARIYHLRVISAISMGTGACTTPLVSKLARDKDDRV